MKRLLLIVLLLVTLGGTARAETMKSTLGYSVSVPSNWLILTREEVQKNPDIFENIDAVGKMDKTLLKNIMTMIKDGKADFIFRTDYVSSGFSDNINIIKQVQKTPSTDDELQELCSILPEEFQKYFGRKVLIYSCEFRVVSGLKSVYTEFDGVVPGTRSMQYCIPRTKSVALIVTATADTDTFSEVATDFAAMIKSLKNN